MPANDEVQVTKGPALAKVRQAVKVAMLESAATWLVRRALGTGP